MSTCVNVTFVAIKDGIASLEIRTIMVTHSGEIDVLAIKKALELKYGFTGISVGDWRYDDRCPEALQ